MNHVIQINEKHFLIRQQSQKILLLTFPELKIIQKYYINANTSSLNPDTHELLIIFQNQLTILKPAIMPLQFVSIQQSFIDWEPQGGLLLPQAIVLYGLHTIVFYNRAVLIDKSWEIDIVQDIECIKSTPKGDCLGMKVRSPNNSLFLWNTNDPSVKPTQQIILNQSIIEWEFTNSDQLTILTPFELRIYRRDFRNNQFNLYHFYQTSYRTFTWISLNQKTPVGKQSVSTLALLGKQGQCSIIQLFEIQKRTQKSEYKQIGKFRLHHKDINMRKIIGGWGVINRLALVCETKNHSLFSFLFSSSLQVQYEAAYQNLLGSDINQVYCVENSVLARDRTRWKLFKFCGSDDYDLLDQIDCQKVFIADEATLLCFDKQSLFGRKKGKNMQPIPFKYPDPAKIQYIGKTNQYIFFVAGIRFYKWDLEGGVSACGIALRNQKAVLIDVDAFAKTILYKIGQQYLLLTFRIDNQKITASTLKSCSNVCYGFTGGYWVQKLPLEIKVGLGQKTLTVFSINKLLKMLDCQNQIFEYSISSISHNGFVIIIKNYAFFLELMEDEKGFDIVILKRLKTILYRRFDPLGGIVKLIQPKSLTFWTGNQVIRVGSRLNQHIASDPFSLPETLIGKQMDLLKTYPPHHPKLLLALIQSNKFELLFQILHKIHSWFQKQGGMKQLYEEITIQFLTDCDWLRKETSISLLHQQKLQQQEQFLKKFSEKILQSTDKIQLRDKNPLIFQSIISSLANLLVNSKNVDFFSQSIVLLLKTPLKSKSFNSMQIVLMAHSLNKEEALAELKNEKSNNRTSWDWISSLGLPFWYDNRQQLRNLIQEYAANQYRSKKDPFDCLFWYLLIGKKSLISTLFKNHRINSKQHEATSNFLMRDFNQPKDRTAAIKNAYVLIDKKRYAHAMSFFILGGSIDDCIRICVDRLHDLCLAYTFVLLFKEANSAYLYGQMSKGDVWMRHLVYKLSSQHIKSYNTLFQYYEPGNWNFTPQLAYFHPILPDFALKIKNSVGVRRQLDAQNAKAKASDDIFADFYGQSQKIVETETIKISLEGDPENLKRQVIKYYLRQGLPALALIEDQSSKQVLDAYHFERYKISGKVHPSMSETIEKLQDKIAFANCLLESKKFQQILSFFQSFSRQFSQIIKNINLTIVVKTKKHNLSDLIRFGYENEQIHNLFYTKYDLWQQKMQIFEEPLKRLQQFAQISKIIASILLNYYQDLAIIFDNLAKPSKKLKRQQDIWKQLKSRYQLFSQIIKQKPLKQMDHFEHAFVAIRRKTEEQMLRSDLRINKQEGAVLLLHLIILNYLLSLGVPAKDELNLAKIQIIQYIKNWLTSEDLQDLAHEYEVLIKEGSQSKLKLNTLKSIFNQSFPHIYDIVALTHQNYFQNYIIGQSIESHDFNGIEIFRNRIDGLRSFAINQYDSRGLQCIIMFKKGLKKIEVCQSLAHRERAKDGFSLVSEDSFYNNLSNNDPHTIQKGKYQVNIQKALSHILERKRETQFPRVSSPFSGRQYLRQIDPPYLNYNQLNSIQCHPFLPFFLIGGKGSVQLAHISTLKNFDRIKCPQVGQIVKLHTSQQRIGVADNLGNFGVHILDNKYINACVFSLKKANIIDFNFIRPSVLAILSSTSLHVYDTLLHPRRQLKFKQTFNKDPISISTIDQTRIAVLRKNQVLIYDIRMQKLQSSKELKSKGKSMYIQGKWVYVGQSDCNVKVFSCKDDQNQNIRLTVLDEKDRQKVAVEQLRGYKDIVLASTSQGSIFYLPKLP